MANYRIKKELRDEILDKVKNKGISVVQASKDYGVSDKTIYSWLRTKATGVVSIVYTFTLPSEDM